MTNRGRKPKPPAPAEAGGDARAKLIAAGYRVLAERGYDATTVKEVARVAGVNQGLVHYYFGSKDALLLAVTDEACRQYTDELQRLRDETPHARLADASFAWGERTLRTAPETFRLRYELFALGLRNRELTAGVAALLRAGQEGVARTVAAVRGGPGTAPGREDGHLAFILKACFDGLALRSLVDPDFDARPVYAYLERLALGALEREGGRPAGRRPRAQARRGARAAPRRR